MLRAHTNGTTRQPHTSGEPGTCPHCNQPVRGKVGNIITPHWAHLAADDCDQWTEPETEWHRQWKQHLANAGCQIEQTIERDGIRHRADAIANNTIIEIQRKALPTGHAAARERFYGDMIWIVDGTHLGERFHRGKPSIAHPGRTGAWIKQGPKSWTGYTRPIFVDLGPETDPDHRCAECGRYTTPAPAALVMGWRTICQHCHPIATRTDYGTNRHILARLHWCGIADNGRLFTQYEQTDRTELLERIAQRVGTFA